ncbi:MAG: class I SAM-dependent methyltransferase [Candidatus Korobacteraceae bacterium]|jgi:SAM-dependent methyltransferase
MHEKIQLPLPPIDLRRAVSPITDESFYSNPNGDYVWGPLDIPPLLAGEAYRKIFDFGCGCGREARQLLGQSRQPEMYVGIDINADMIEWCQENLQNDRFKFYYHDVWSASYAPGNKRNRFLPIEHLGRDFTIIEANSVFTHLHADQSQFYLDQMRKMLSPKGLIRASWFFFNKDAFPPMGETQNTLFIDEADLTLGVYYAWSFFVAMIRRLGYRLIRAEWAYMLGFHNIMYLSLNKDFADLSDVNPPGSSVVGF